MSYDDNIGENYDKIHSIYSDIVKSDTDILKKPKTKSKIEDFLVYLFDWKFVFFFLFTVIVLFTIASNEIRKLLIKFKLYDVYGTDMISFFIYGIIINMFIGLFILTFYFYKKKIIGSKGPRGNIGDIDEIAGGRLSGRYWRSGGDSGDIGEYGRRILCI